MLILAFKLCCCVKRVDKISDGGKKSSMEENMEKEMYPSSKKGEKNLGGQPTKLGLLFKKFTGTENKKQKKAKRTTRHSAGLI